MGQHLCQMVIILVRGINGSTSWTDLNETIYNAEVATDDIGVPYMIEFGGAIYVAFGDDTTRYLCKYTYSGGNITETEIYSSTSNWIQTFAKHPDLNFFVAGTSNGKILQIQENGTVSITNAIGPTNIQKIAIQKIPTGHRIWMHNRADDLRYTNWTGGLALWTLLTGTRPDSSNLPWDTATDTRTKYIETIRNVSGGTSEQLIFNWIDETTNSSDPTSKYHASRHNDNYSSHWTSTTAVFGALPTGADNYTENGVVRDLKRMGPTPTGESYLYFNYSNYIPNYPVDTDTYGGSIHKVGEDTNEDVIGSALYQGANLGLIKGHNIVMINDLTTHDDYLKYGTGYIVNFYISYTDINMNTTHRSYHVKDVGWQSSLTTANGWASSGSCEWRWVDLSSKTSLPAIYHKKDRNPVIPFGDSFRVFPGNVGKIGSAESKGVWVGHIDRSLFGEKITHSPDFYGYENRLTNPFAIKTASQKELEDDIHPSDKIKYSVTAIYDGIQETELPTGLTEVLLLTSATVPNTSKCENLVHISFATSTLNKRITGLKLYRSYPSTTGVYEPFKLIKSYNFVDSNINTSYDPESKLFYIAKRFNDKYAHIYDSDDAVKNWIIDARDGGDEQFTSTGTGFTWGGGVLDRKYALKIGSQKKNRIEQITGMQHFPVISGVTLMEGISSSDTTLKVTTTTGLVVSTSYLMGHRGFGTNDSIVNSTWNSYGSFSSSNNEYQNYEGITITSIDAPNDKIVVTRASTIGGQATSAVPHSAGAPLKQTALAYSKWYLFKVNKDFKSYYNESFRIYKERTGPGWYDSSVSKSERAFSGKNLLYLYPRINLDDDSPDFSSWRFADNTINISQLVGRQTFFYNSSSTAPDLKEDASASDVYETKIREAYSYATYEQDGIIPVFNNVKLPEPSSSLKSIGEYGIYNAISVDVNTDGNSQINILDDGLTSLNEHSFESENNTTINGQYGKVLKGRLFLGNIVLDPGNEQEDHSDWVAYSELDQFDIRPVSNIIPFEDREGGPITGLSEIFGRLVIFKPQAIFVLDVPDSSNPTGWIRKESKVNIGNVAKEGLVEVHDSIFIVHNDGIYSVTANMIASATATPSKLEKITDDIDNIFVGIDSKGDVKGIYDQLKNEIIYRWTRNSAKEIWAYNIYKKNWRQINLSGNADIWGYNENSNPLAWDITNKKVLLFDVPTAVGTLWKSKRFRLDYDRKRLIRYATLRHTNTDNITFNIYLDGSNSASFTKSITTSGTSAVSKFPVKRYLKNFEVELTTASSLNNVEIEQLTFEME